MGAKYKVGQLMSIPHHSNPLPIAEVVTCYRFVKEIGALWREEELTPYVRPLQVGDRVRWHKDVNEDPPLEILAINGPVAWCKRIRPLGGYSTLNVCHLERIPTEAA